MKKRRKKPFSLKPSVREISMPWRVPMPSLIDAREKLFTELVAVLGMPQYEAYLIAFQTDAARLSATSASSALIRLPRIQEAVLVLNAHGFLHNARALKSIKSIMGK